MSHPDPSHDPENVKEEDTMNWEDKGEDWDAYESEVENNPKFPKDQGWGDNYPPEMNNLKAKDLGII